MFTGKVDTDGKLQIDIEDEYLAGIEIAVHLKDDKEKESKVTAFKVQDSWVAPVEHEVMDQDEKVIQKLKTPTIHDYYITDAFAKGIAPGASRVALYVEGEFIRTAALSADGTYTIYTGDQKGLQKENQTFQIVARDSDGHESEKATNIVKVASTLTVQEHKISCGR
ncbi:hypothetical protein COL26_33205 [Bacillus thuringiensis]|uniref:Uncharacterized protein n=1 Tax=Bacillus thuringiensis TaxID=1428 RepID=A0ABD6S3G1_BACTU|nr:hypothetical protein [Bacillus thuringiensis]PER51001.1 hypothetical protein CN495_20280 [Bacillus thuringiensis]PEU86374.1 hypothetical protein CN411_18375 [Bacillus thuringiensis]PFI13467.1 hypothetical protein COI79_01020 [Bacillus thuringiensis]PFW19010.1 hypothetical protein COL26_33205 [Bacillus thuringiensis]PGY84768.1 hypothetical protein COE44_00745 [Bacillus thuringiensis]